MATMNISLPDELRDFVNHQVAESSPESHRRQAQDRLAALRPGFATRRPALLPGRAIPVADFYIESPDRIDVPRILHGRRDIPAILHATSGDDDA